MFALPVLPKTLKLQEPAGMLAIRTQDACAPDYPYLITSVNMRPTKTSTKIDALSKVTTMMIEGAVNESAQAYEIAGSGSHCFCSS